EGQDDGLRKISDQIYVNLPRLYVPEIIQIYHTKNLQSLIQNLVRIGIQTLPEGTLDTQIVGGVERELIEQVMQMCEGVQVTAAKRLGINRNTLHKKLDKFSRPGGAASDDGEVREES
ncbi:MAG: helix-turn-helix domain-containing protein, partial [Gemmataceae bacterium]|nr:helix-turn-helix domain-containing protein [Gemmataceae bacterium]